MPYLKKSARFVTRSLKRFFHKAKAFIVPNQMYTVCRQNVYFSLLLQTYRLLKQIPWFSLSFASDFFISDLVRCFNLFLYQRLLYAIDYLFAFSQPIVSHCWAKGSPIFSLSLFQVYPRKVTRTYSTTDRPGIPALRRPDIEMMKGSVETLFSVTFWIII